MEELELELELEVELEVELEDGVAEVDDGAAVAAAAPLFAAVAPADAADKAVTPAMSMPSRCETWRSSAPLSPLDSLAPPVEEDGVEGALAMSAAAADDDDDDESLALSESLNPPPPPPPMPNALAEAAALPSTFLADPDLVLGVAGLSSPWSAS